MRSIENQRAISVRTRHSTERQMDRPRVCARLEHEIVLKLAASAVVDQIDARVDAVVCDAPVVRDVGLPAAGIAADEVVALARALIEADDCGVRVGPIEAEMKDVAGNGGSPARSTARRLCALRLHGQHGFGRRQE